MLLKNLFLPRQAPEFPDSQFAADDPGPPARPDGDLPPPAEMKAVDEVVALFPPAMRRAVQLALARLTSAAPARAFDTLLAARTLSWLTPAGEDASVGILAAPDGETLADQVQRYATHFGQPGSHAAPVALGVFATEPDWTDGRYQLYAAHGEADCIRYGQGKRYDFCISRRHHNFYQKYRADYKSSYYFVYDNACNPLDKNHVTVVAVRPDGSCEFTCANNAEDYHTRQLHNSLDRFLLTKPGLEQASAWFTCRPPTPAEESDVLAARAAGSETCTFEALTPEQQLLFVGLGSLLTDAAYARASQEVQEAYISRCHLLTDPQAACSTEPQRRRAAQLFRLFNVTERLHSADWLTRYPLPTPATVVAHHTTQWPPSAAALATWPKSGPAPPAPAVRDTGKAAGGLSIIGPAGRLNLNRLQRAVAATSPALFPVQELALNPLGATDGPVIIARHGAGYVILTGNAHLGRAQMAGDVDIVVWLATRANLAYARVEETSA